MTRFLAFYIASIPFSQVRLSLGGKLNFVLSYDVSHNQTLVRAAGKTPGPLQLAPWLHLEEERNKV